jgi:opacity protein-like surface antigen
MNKLVKISAAIISSVAFVGAAQAATPGAYAGAGLGYSAITTPNVKNNPTIANHYSSHSFFPMSEKSNSGGIGGRVFGGYNFNKYFGLEAAYTQYAGSKSQEGENNTGTGPLGASIVSSKQAAQKVSENALSLVGKAYLPIEETGLNLYALGGVAETFSKNKYYATSNVTQNGVLVSPAPISQSYSTRALRPTYGMGVSYDINSKVTTNLEYSRIQGRGNINTNDLAVPSANLVSLNLSYNFG